MVSTLAQTVVVVLALPMRQARFALSLSVPLPTVFCHRAGANRVVCYTGSLHALAWEAVARVSLLIHLAGLGSTLPRIGSVSLASSPSPV